MQILQLQSIAIQQGGREIFRDLSWALDEHAKVGLVGANGAGKSTLTNCRPPHSAAGRRSWSRWRGWRRGRRTCCCWMNRIIIST